MRRKTKTIPTKSKRMGRVSIGEHKLDSLIKGFKEKSINLIMGAPGTGKTIMALQFLIDGMRKGETCVYITFEERKEKIYDDVLSFGWDLAKFEKAKKFAFLEYTPEQIKKILVEGGGELENIIDRMKATRIVIDSINSFALSYQGELERKESYLFLFELLNKWNCTAVITEGIRQEEVYSELQFSVDSIIVLYYQLKGERKSRTLDIIKMRGTKIPPRTFKFDILSKGIAILS
jgi:circadian clock protein KaiC